jgi:hypothetical protein
MEQRPMAKPTKIKTLFHAFYNNPGCSIVSGPLKITAADQEEALLLAGQRLPDCTIVRIEQMQDATASSPATYDADGHLATLRWIGQ